MRSVTRTRAAIAATALAAVALATPASAGLLPSGGSLAPVQPWLSSQLGTLQSATLTTVLVHGTDTAAAKRAVSAAGMKSVTTFDKIGVVVATGLPAQIQAVRDQSGVTYVEGNEPIAMTLATSNKATRGEEARNTLRGADGTSLDGKGVSVAFIDSGVDPSHPFLQNADGTSAVVKNLKMVCEPLTESTCAPVDAGPLDTDLLSLGGHGMHVNGIVAGRDVTLSDGTKMHGAAPGASLVSISTGAVLFIIGADAALNWVLENHDAPCGAGVSASTCPPIKVTSNSYGPTGGGAFDQNTGTRDGTVSDFSSRGKNGDQSTYPDISAPGEDITSSCRVYLPICSTGLDPKDAGDYNTISGTSMATPHISGIVAQLFQANPSATPAQIEAAIESTAYKYTDGARYEGGTNGTTSFDKGHGLVDVVGAANAVR